MKCLIMGSLKQEGIDKVAFDAACQELGEELADRGHTIIINAIEPWTADLHALEGANRVSGKRPTVIFLKSSGGPNQQATAVSHIPGYVPDGQESQDLSRFTNVDLQVQTVEAQWPGNRIQAISKADVVLLIGGRYGVAAVGASAPLLKTPVVAIKSFGGAASEIWDEANFVYGKAGISPEDASALRNAWSSNSASAVIRVAEVLVKRNPFQKDRIPHVFVAGSLFLLIASWIAIYLLGAKTPNVSLFSLLGISALLGTGLRTELRLLGDYSGFLSGRRIGVEATAGVLLAFIFCLLYLSGSYVFTGDVLTLTNKPPADFARVAIILSLLGISTAFLLESAAENARIRLEQFIRNSS